MPTCQSRTARPPMTRMAIPLAALLACSLGACSGQPTADADAGMVKAEGVPMRTVSLAEATSLPSVVDATRKMGVVMLAAAPHDRNAVSSPSSLAIALAMITEGAKTNTLTELETVLGATGEHRRDAFTALRQSLLKWDGDPQKAAGKELPDHPIIHLADQVVANKDYPISKTFLNSLASGFGAGMQRVDFSSPEGKQVLDAWIKKHTGGLIEKSALEPDKNTLLVLQDAMILAARWQSPFLPRDTQKRPFKLADGTEVPVRTMEQIHDFSYAEVEGWKAVRMPYADAAHSDVILPPSGTDPAAITPDLYKKIYAALSTASPQRVSLWLPVLDVIPDPADLSPVIKTLGAPSLLCESKNTDLSGIGGGCVAEAKQKTVLKVSEEGTVAAAVTEINVVISSNVDVGDAVTLHFDHPYLFTVSHTQTSTPLIMAAIRNPGK